MDHPCAIIVIDLQEKLIPAIHEGVVVVQQVKRLLRFADLMGIPVLATEQVPKKLGGTLSEIQSMRGWPVAIEKSTFSAAPVLPMELPNRLYVVGVETHVCIRQTLFDLHQRNHDLCVLADAVGSRRRIDHEVALQEFRSVGMQITTVEAMAFEMLGSAEHPNFRMALDIFKTV